MLSKQIIRIRAKAESQLEVIKLHRDQKLRRFVCLVRLLDSLEYDLCCVLREEILDQLSRENARADTVGEPSSSEPVAKATIMA